MCMNALMVAKGDGQLGNSLICGMEAPSDGSLGTAHGRFPRDGPLRTARLGRFRRGDLLRIACLGCDGLLEAAPRQLVCYPHP